MPSLSNTQHSGGHPYGSIGLNEMITVLLPPARLHVAMHINQTGQLPRMRVRRIRKSAAERHKVGASKLGEMQGLG